MSLQTNFTQAPAGELDRVFLRLRHESWALDLWYVDDVVAWNVDDEEGNPVTAQPTGLDADGEPTDETGIDSRGISVPDHDFTLWRLFETLKNTGNTVPVEGTAYRYLSSDVSQPAAYVVLSLSKPSRDGRLVSFELSNANVLKRSAPPRLYTYSNSPGLRR